MTTTELIELLKQYEKGASGRSREITIYVNAKCKKRQIKVMREEDRIEMDSTGDGGAGAEISLIIKRAE